MKKMRFILPALLLALGLAACGMPAAAEAPTPKPAAESTPEPRVVVFADPVLEAMVRATMGKPEGDVTMAEAEAVTRLNLSIEWQRYVSKGTPIQDIGGLESFRNLESLDLSFHAITDITPLAGLKELASLSLGGNPVADIAPLAGLTNLKVLMLSNCAARDYGPLAGLVNLKFLVLDNSAIADVAPLASLTSLRHLYLAGCPINDYSPLADIYPNLEEKDFTMASTLSELGFTRPDDSVVASYTAEGLTVGINHDEWGVPAMEAENNCVKMDLTLDRGYTLIVMRYPEIDAWVFQMVLNGGMLVNYIYDAAKGSFSFGMSDRESTEQVVRTGLGDIGTGGILLAPITVFNDMIKNTLGMTADALYALPFEPPTLNSLGFVADEGSSSYLFEQRDPHYYTVQISNPQWGSWDGGGNVRFFTPLSDEYRIVVTYYAQERKLLVKADDNDGGGASFELFVESYEHVDGWCSNEKLSVEEYFINAYNDPGIEDIYRHSVEFMLQYISDTFGMTIEELYALPVGE